MVASFPIFTLEQPAELLEHLSSLGWIRPDDKVLSLERAGEGNMNLVVRVTTASGSFIFKQSRPWVEKYPQIAAPADRLLTETAFYRVLSPLPDVSGGMPALLGVNTLTRSARFQDLGRASDATDLYSGASIDMAPLVGWVGKLHQVVVPEPLRSQLLNHSMRALNHAHIFDLPMSGAHGMDLDSITPGLTEAALWFRSLPGIQRVVADLGERYLADGTTLLHGDYYPGSWLRTVTGPMVIDPEFCFLGPAEFDLGVLKAHLLLAGWTMDSVSAAMAGYRLRYDSALTDRFAGVEIMRRLIGVAQLPLERNLDEKRNLLNTAQELILA